MVNGYSLAKLLYIYIFDKAVLWWFSANIPSGHWPYTKGYIIIKDRYKTINRDTYCKTLYNKKYNIWVYVIEIHIYIHISDEKKIILPILILCSISIQEKYKYRGKQLKANIYMYFILLFLCVTLYKSWSSFWIMPFTTLTKI